ncbi:MAG: hypothetical protein ACI9UA_004105, partial [Pseudoalteromonas tetraodonis]
MFPSQTNTGSDGDSFKYHSLPNAIKILLRPQVD